MQYLLTLLNRLRLLPVLTVCIALLFGVKLGDVRDGVASISAGPGTALAEDKAPPASLEPPPAAAPAAEPAAPAQTPAPSNDIASMSESEVALLQRLAGRREVLNDRTKQLETRESLLVAAEKRIEERILKLSEIESSIARLIDTFDKQENARIGKLVLVYQSMKAKDAAAIFDQLDMKVLLAVAQRMDDAKMAEILGKMTAVSAKKLTEEMARQKQLPDAAS